MENIIIIGSGPAGYTAAIYAARAGLAPVIFSGEQIGGQLTTTTEVENFPGFPMGILGPELMLKMREQAERFGAKIIDKTVTAVDFCVSPKKVMVGDETFEAKAVIIATGASARRLGLANEQSLYGKGVSACATCDGFFFKGKNVVVVGGGDTAMEEANYLTKFASRVTIIHRRDEFRASAAMVEKAKQNPKIDFLMNSAVIDILGADVGKVVGINVQNLVTGKATELAVDGVFAAIGHEPNTKLFAGQLDLDAAGYLVVSDVVKTKIPGVFASGDVADHRYRQAIAAAGTGCMAALEADRFLDS